MVASDPSHKRGQNIGRKIMSKTHARAIGAYLSVLPTGPDQHEVHLTRDTRAVVASAAEHLDRQGPVTHQGLDLHNKNMPKDAERNLNFIFANNSLRLFINVMLSITYALGKADQRAEDRQRRI